MSIDLDIFFKTIAEDIFSNIKKENPNILIFTNQSSKEEEYIIYNLFLKYSNNLSIIGNNLDDLENKILEADIVYFHGGNPYKYTTYSKYRELIKNIPIKIGNSAGAIFLSNHTFYVQKDDYIIAIPEMLNYINLHIFAHSEIYQEKLVFDYLLYENPTNILKLYGNSCIKIEYLKNKLQKIYSIIDNSDNNNKIELFIKDILYTSNENKEIDLIENIINL